ncbi:MAG: M14 family zinc carboxypeptidase [Ignavibacteria bacterium]|nr:M14 family zinc carboxypeptidase [Ignavibacteria bacterium]
MIPSTLARHLFSTYPEYRLDHLQPTNCVHREIVEELRRLADKSNDLLKIEELGCSLEGRSINLVTCGLGSRKILLWSQMHGDESTGTLALMDIFNLMVHRNSNEIWLEKLLAGTTLHFIPMLNPDGAERVERRTAVEIDVNRDARSLATPEARILRNAQRCLRPIFGFNLHDQELGTVGNSKAVTAVALLAPALDERKTTPRARLRAMRVAALIVRSLNQFIEGHIAAYDDSFEPRAFGENMLGWGTSTLLLESGHWPNDRKKVFIRKLNYVAILSAVHAIGNGSYQDVDLDYYFHLKANGKNVYDIIIRNIVMEHPKGWSHPVEIGLSLEPKHNRPVKNPGGNLARPVVTVKDIGDLSVYAGLQIVDGHGRRLASTTLASEQVLSLEDLFDKLQLYYPTV